MSFNHRRKRVFVKSLLCKPILRPVEFQDPLQEFMWRCKRRWVRLESMNHLRSLRRHGLLCIYRWRRLGPGSPYQSLLLWIKPSFREMIQTIRRQPSKIMSWTSVRWISPCPWHLLYHVFLAWVRYFPAPLQALDLPRSSSSNFAWTLLQVPWSIYPCITGAAPFHFAVKLLPTWVRGEIATATMFVWFCLQITWKSVRAIWRCQKGSLIQCGLFFSLQIVSFCSIELNSIGLFTFHAFRGIQHTQQLHPFSFLKFHVLEVIETSLSHHQELDNSHVWRRNRSCGDNSPVLLETEGMISEFHQSFITHRSCNSANIQKPTGLLSFESSTPPKAPKLNNPDYTPPS